MERTTVGRWVDVIVVLGGCVDGVPVVGLFDSEEDARSEDADALAIGTVGLSSLSDEQLAMAGRNGLRLCGPDEIAEAVENSGVAFPADVVEACKAAYAAGEDWVRVLWVCMLEDRVELRRYPFATDSEAGSIDARSFAEARAELARRVPSSAVAAGGCGCVGRRRVCPRVGVSRGDDRNCRRGGWRLRRRGFGGLALGRWRFRGRGFRGCSGAVRGGFGVGCSGEGGSVGCVIPLRFSWSKFFSKFRA